MPHSWILRNSAGTTFQLLPTVDTPTSSKAQYLWHGYREEQNKQGIELIDQDLEYQRTKQITPKLFETLQELGVFEKNPTYQGMSMQSNFFSLIQQGMQKRGRSYGRTVGRYWPTDASIKMPDGTVKGKCLRELWYLFNKVMAPVPSDLAGSFKMIVGEYIEQMLRDVLAYTASDVVLPDEAVQDVIRSFEKQQNQAAKDLHPKDFEDVAGNLRHILQEHCIDPHNGEAYTVPLKFEIDLATGNTLIGHDCHGYDADYDFEANPVISGKFDIITRENGELHGNEIKSFSGYARRTIFAKNPFPKEEHLMQVMMYNIARPDIHWHIQYIDRGKMDTATFDISLEDQVAVVNHTIQYDWSVLKIIKRYRELHEYLVKDELPPADFKCLYTTEEIERMYRQKKIYKKTYESWKNGERLFLADFPCMYCDYQPLCLMNSKKVPDTPVF